MCLVCSCTSMSERHAVLGGHMRIIGVRCLAVAERRWLRAAAERRGGLMPRCPSPWIKSTHTHTVLAAERRRVPLWLFLRKMSAPQCVDSGFAPDELRRWPGAQCGPTCREGLEQAWRPQHLIGWLSAQCGAGCRCLHGVMEVRRAPFVAVLAIPRHSYLCAVYRPLLPQCLAEWTSQDGVPGLTTGSLPCHV